MAGQDLTSSIFHPEHAVFSQVSGPFTLFEVRLCRYENEQGTGTQWKGQVFLKVVGEGGSEKDTLIEELKRVRQQNGIPFKYTPIVGEIYQTKQLSSRQKVVELLRKVIQLLEISMTSLEYVSCGYMINSVRVKEKREYSASLIWQHQRSSAHCSSSSNSNTAVDPVTDALKMLSIPDPPDSDSTTTAEHSDDDTGNRDRDAK